MKRSTKLSSGRAATRSPKLPDELLPIVDAVVEIVFERVRSATAESVSKGAPGGRQRTKLNLPLPKQRTALAEALADLLLADLASRARQRPAKPRRATSAPVSRRGTTTAKKRRPKRRPKR